MSVIFKNYPKLVVFDLDYTLWPFYVDTHVTLPFVKRNATVVDRYGHTVSYYKEVPKIFDALSALGCDLAVASRTGEIDGANQLIQLFGWEGYFKYKEIYPGCKVEHFQNFKKKSKINFEDMLFFDDEDRNIYDISKLNVTCILVEKMGMTFNLLEKGLKQFDDLHSMCE